jgi:hypothetical protein
LSIDDAPDLVIPYSATSRHPDLGREVRARAQAPR